jgi:ABC-2 type transport system permease protein
MPAGMRFFVRQMNVQIRVRTLNLLSLLLLILQPAIFSGVGFILSRMAGKNTPDLVYAIIGGGVMGLWSSLLFTSFYDISRDRWEGTLELIVGSPTPLRVVLWARTLANVLFGSLSMVASFLVAAFLFHYSFAKASLPSVIISILLLVFAFWCSGIFLANFHAWSRVSGTAINYLELPVAVICGFMFPVRILPAWMQIISTILPMRWAVEAVQGSLLGQIDTFSLIRLWLMAIAISAIYFVLAVWLESKVHHNIRVTGSYTSI